MMQIDVNEQYFLTPADLKDSIGSIGNTPSLNGWPRALNPPNLISHQSKLVEYFVTQFPSSLAVVSVA